MKYIFSFILLTYCSFALSEEGWLVGTEYQQVSSEVDVHHNLVDFKVGVLTAYVGYELPLTSKWSAQFSLSAGKSVKQDNNKQIVVYGDILVDVDMEVSTYVRFQTQFDYAIHDNGYVFLAPGIAQYDFNAKRPGENLSVSEWRLALSAGYSHKIGDKGKVKLTYNYLPDTNVVAIGYERRF
ncbi:MAG: hypothetical protein Alis3KO_31550 [Aliiglaciecola sp.]